MRVSRAWALALGAATALACGAEGPEGAASRGGVWRDPGATSTGLNTPPVIESVRILPEEPGPGETVQAVVRASDADGEKLDLSFEWTAGGRPRSESGGALELVVSAPPASGPGADA